MPFPYICPFCKQTVQAASQLPVGRPVKCPGCKKLYTAGAPGAVGIDPAPRSTSVPRKATPPFGYICPFCSHNVQTASQLPLGRPVRCPGCKKLYAAGAPNAVGTNPASPPKPNVGAAAAGQGKTSRLPRGWFRAGANRIGKMGWKQLLATCFFLFMFAFAPSIYGWSERQVSSTATVEPLAVELEQLENGPAPDNNHLKIGSHIACYFATVYKATARGKGPKRPNENTQVSYCFYPIVSTTHPYSQHLRQLEQKYGSADKVPENVMPRLSELKVLVKTSRFRTVGDIPDAWRTESAVQGLVINRISTLSSEEQKLIQQDFGTIDFSKVLILSEGRRPSSLLFSLFLLCVSVPFWLGLFGVLGVWAVSRVRKLV